jgi:hypothetical protein
MFPSHLDCGFLTGRHDNELRRATVVIGAEAHDVDLGHSGAQNSRKPRGEQEGVGFDARAPSFFQIVVYLTDSGEPDVLKVGEIPYPK